MPLYARLLFIALGMLFFAFVAVRHARGLWALTGEVRGQYDGGGQTGQLFILPFLLAVPAAMVTGPTLLPVLPLVLFIVVMTWVTARFFRLKDSA